MALHWGAMKVRGRKKEFLFLEFLGSRVRVRKRVEARFFLGFCGSEVGCFW